MKPGSFEALLVFIDAHQAYSAPDAAQELTPLELEAMTAAAIASPEGFLLACRRNWAIEYIARRIRLPAAVRHLYRLPDGEAVDRLLGWHTPGDHWHPGLAGLEPQEARILRLRVCDRHSVADVCYALSVQPKTVYNALSRSRSALRTLFLLDSDSIKSGRFPDGPSYGSNAV